MRRWLGRIPGIGAITQAETGPFLAIAALVGFVVGLGSAGLILGIQWVEDVTAEVMADRSAWLWFVTIPFVLTVSWLLSRRFAPETMGSGISEVIGALALHGGRLRTISFPIKLIASSVAVGGGGSGGREGPVVQIGGTIASSIARRFGLGEDMVRSLVAAGAGAGLGASFSAPIAGMLFALEVIIGSFSIRHMSAVVLASVTAAITTGSIVGEGLILVGLPFSLASPWELLLYGVLAVTIALFGVLFLHLIARLDPVTKRFRGIGRPLVFGLVTAGIVVVDILVLGGFFAGDRPRVTGTGQGLLSSFISMTSNSGAVWWALLALGLLKMVATATTHASGASAGLFMPCLVIGGVLGAAFESAISPFWEVSVLQPGAFAVVGMATMYAAVDRAPLTAILIIFEITGTRNYGLILPLMLSATLATVVAERLHAQSLHEAALDRKGIRLPRIGEIDILDTVLVDHVMTRSPLRFRDSMSVARVRRTLDARHTHGAPIVDAESRLVGIVTVSDLARVGSDDTPVADVMTPRPVTVTPTTPVSTALQRMATLGIGRLPVVAEDDPTRLIGLFRREDAVSAYHRALGSSTAGELGRRRLRMRTSTDVRYFEFHVPAGSMADRRSVAEVTWPDGCTLVSIQRGTLVLVPTGGTELVAGDVVTAFGSEAAEQSIVGRLATAMDEPTVEFDAAVDGSPEPPPA